ncbi:unnamed protein product [Calypogeia fissa]
MRGRGREGLCLALACVLLFPFLAIAVAIFLEVAVGKEGFARAALLPSTRLDFWSTVTTDLVGFPFEGWKKNEETKKELLVNSGRLPKLGFQFSS